MHNAGDAKVFISIASSVLALRGNDVVPQPIFQEQSKTFLCWNGEAWKLSNHTSGAQGEITGNDAAAVFRLLVPNNPPQGASVAHHQICKSFEAVTGPFAMAFFDSRFQRLYFGRDFLGRRSMVVGKASNGDYIISSIPNADPGVDWYELNADGIYWIPLELQLNSTDFVVNRVNYVPPNSSMANSRDLMIVISSNHEVD
jgi:asparagine synthetase B (glutamine-hydrolysing)